MRGTAFRAFALPWMYAALLAGMTATVMAADPAAPNPNTAGNTLGTLLEAMQQGDEPTAERIYRSATDPAIHVLSAMVIERIHFHLDAATADARLCEKDLFDSRPGIALLCGQFRSGDLRLAGQRAEADDVERELIRRFQNHRVDKALARMQAYLASSQAGSPALSYERPTSDVAVPLKDGVWSPTFEASANGHALDLMLDTGANDLVLGAEQARVCGVRLLDRNARVAGWISKGIEGQRGLLDELKIGSITLHHVPVMVVPRSIALIGANLVAPLGTLRIGHKPPVMTVYGSAASVPACRSPMRTGSNLWGTHLRLLPRLLVNDKPQALELDTGSSSYLLGGRKALDEVTVLHRGKLPIGDIGGSHPFASARRAKVKLTISGQPIEVYFAVLTDSTALRDTASGIVLGAGALRDMDFLLDFRHQRMCFLLHPDLH